MAPFSDTYAEAKAAALRALAMDDPPCAAAQTALGAVLEAHQIDNGQP
jgi:hypothetical protein